MNNLQKEVSAYLLNDNQFERAINTLLIEVLKPVERAIEQQNSGAFGETYHSDIHSRALFISDLLRQMSGNSVMTDDTITDDLATKKLKEIKEYLEGIKAETEMMIKEIESDIMEMNVGTD